MGSAPVPPLPYRARPSQLLLVVGAVLVVSAGGAAAAVYGGGSARVLLLALAAAAAGASAWGSHARLRATEETLAAAAVALAVLGADAGTPLLRGSVVPPLVLGGVFLVLARLLRRPATWPLAAWLALQLAAVRALDGSGAGVVRTAELLTVALVGLGVALGARRLVARVSLVTAAPWWVAGVVGALGTAWSGDAAARWTSAALTVAAALELVAARLVRTLEPLLGPPVAVPVLAGTVSGAALCGALGAPGPGAVLLAGYTGVLIAAAAAALLTGWVRGLFLPAALAAGGTLVVLSVGQLVAGSRWLELVLLLVLTALPCVLVAALRGEDRPVAVPAAVGCLAAAALVAAASGLVGVGGAAGCLGVLYAASLGAGLVLDPRTRRATVVTGAVCAALAVVLLVVARDRTMLAVQLAAQGLLTSAWGWFVWHTPDPRRGQPEGSPAWRAGAAQLVGAAWTAAALAGWSVVEAYTLPAALGLLLAAGPRLAGGPSWPAWGPGLLVAAVPSVVWAVMTPGSTRPVLVLLVAAAVMAAAAWRAVRAPLLVAAWTIVALALGLAVRALPLPVAGALVVGVVLLAVGARRERYPVAGFDARLADMR
ncbi:SCO7613 C-terminal domain-containing membrane protein [Geodermatophilus sp. URMC 65]